MRPSEARTLIGVIAAAFPNVEIEQPTVDLYVGFLRPYDYEAAQDAILGLVSRATYWPRVPEVVGAIRSEVYERARRNVRPELPTDVMAPEDVSTLLLSTADRLEQKTAELEAERAEVEAEERELARAEAVRLRQLEAANLIECPACGGSGKTALGDAEPCERCEGAGMIPAANA